MEIAFQDVWGKFSEQSKSIAFWQGYFNTIPFDVEKRSQQVVYHVLCDNEVIGISTAEELNVKNYNDNVLFNYRMLIHPDYRIPGLADQLATKSFEFLEGLYLNDESKAIGIITLIQNEVIMKKKRNTIYSATGLVFGGYTKSGAEIRLKYFKGARI